MLAADDAAAFVDRLGVDGAVALTEEEDEEEEAAAFFLPPRCTCSSTAPSSSSFNGSFFLAELLFFALRGSGSTSKGSSAFDDPFLFGDAGAESMV